MKNFIEKSYLQLIILLSLLIILSLVTDIAQARPHREIISRKKRVSDQRVAELETLFGLEGVRGKIVLVPVGFGRINPERIGRKRRSSYENDLQRIQSHRRMNERDSGLVSEENDDILNTFLQNDDNRADGGETQLI